MGRALESLDKAFTERYGLQFEEGHGDVISSAEAESLVLKIPETGGNPMQDLYRQTEGDPCQLRELLAAEHANLLAEDPGNEQGEDFVADAKAGGYPGLEDWYSVKSPPIPPSYEAAAAAATAAAATDTS